jgi:hypothetical protein
MINTRTAITKPASWAILIGIDEYSQFSSDDNLRGCANDVAIYHHYLEDHLRLEEAKTFAFIARSSENLPRTASPDPPSDRPTKRRVRKAMDKVLKDADSDDLVLFHFSGHGDRRPTLYTEHKPKGSSDELLCLLDGEISDVELGDWLDKMAKRGVVVLATLDCCFAGGATRGEIKHKLPGGLVRCRPHTQPQPAFDRLLPDIATSESIPAAKSRSMRNAMMKESWIYRHRDYTAMAACQPQEQSREVEGDQCVWHGACTINVVSALHDLGARRVAATYSELQGLVEVKLKNDDRILQRPLLLGEGNRMVFQRTILPDDDPRPSAFVLNVLEEYVNIDAGGFASVRIGDRYRLSHPCWSRDRSVTKDTNDDAVALKITKVESMTARGKLELNNSKTDASSQSEVQTGWFADLVFRVNPMVVPIFSDLAETSIDGENEIMQDVQHSWRSFIDATVPITLIFKETYALAKDPSDHAPKTRQRRGKGRPRKRRQRSSYKFSVKLEDGSFVVLDSQHRPLPHFPRLPANSEDVVKHLMQLLRHLRRFDLVDTLWNLRIDQRPRYELTLKELADPGTEEGVISTWRIHMENLEPDRTLYLTILNLTPLYGILQLVPSQEHRGYPVQPNTPYGSELDIKIPDTLREALKVPGTTMSDVFKFCVATEPIDFRFYVQHDLKSTLHVPSKSRTGSIRAIQSTTWWIDSRTITASLSARSQWVAKMRS